MKVAIYPSHRSLPFWHKPENPTGLFNFASLQTWTWEVRGEGEQAGQMVKLPAQEHWIMPVLNGLASLNLPGVMAHVSFVLDPETSSVSCPKRIWVQITTDATDSTADGARRPDY